MLIFISQCCPCLSVHTDAEDWLGIEFGNFPLVILADLCFLFPSQSGIFRVSSFCVQIGVPLVISVDFSKSI